MMFRFGDDDTIDKDARYLHLPRVERAAFSYSLHLHDDKTPRVLHRHGDCQHFERERFFLHGDVAVRIGRSAANDADIDRKRAIKKKFFAIDLDKANEVVVGALVYFAAAIARIGECSETNAGEMTRSLGRDVAEEM